MRKLRTAGRCLVTACAVLGCVLAPVARAEAQQVKRKPIAPLDKDGGLEYLTNPRPAFLVTLTVDRADRTYYGADKDTKGDTLTATVVSEKDGYTYVFFKNADGVWKTFYPNLTNTDNRIKANEPLEVPGKDVVIRMGGPPYGVEKLKVVVTTKPIALEDAEKMFQKSAAMTPLNPAKHETARFVYSAITTKSAPVPPNMRDAWVEYTRTLPEPKPNQKPDPVQRVIGANQEQLREWAEASVEILTLERGSKPQPFPPILPEPNKPQPPAKFGRRIGIFVGISDYDQKVGRPVPSLQVAHKDAEKMAEVAKKHFGLDDAVVLTNSQATKKNIEEAISNAAQLAPTNNDFVMIFWSGHGGQCANTAGGSGALRQYLIPYDADLLKENDSMVLDTTFAEWVKKLQGRKVLVVLDTCHSGGIIANPQKSVKGLPPQKPILAPKGTWQKQFMETQVKFLKKVNQQDVAVLAASEPTEPALERKTVDLSVFTFFLIEKIEASGGRVTPEQLHEYAKVKVPEYVEKNFTNLTQKPTRGGEITPAPYLLQPPSRP